MRICNLRRYHCDVYDIFYFDTSSYLPCICRLFEYKNFYIPHVMPHAIT